MVTNLRKFAKFTSVALLLGSPFAYANNHCEFEDGKDCVEVEEGAKFFTFNGSVESFSKVGFNRVKADVANNIYPTESFATIHGSFDTQFNIMSFLSTDFISKFEIGLGAAATGMIWDSTLRDSLSISGSGLSTGSGANNNYVGYWAGFLGDGSPYNHYFVFKNAYVDLQTKYLNFKGGRYESSMDYHSAYTQGFNIDSTFAFGDTDARPDNGVKLWWFSSFGRAFAYSQWLYDFYAVKVSDSNGDGKDDTTYGIHAFGTDVTYGGFSENEDGYRYGDSIMVRPFMYFYPGIYESMGMKVVYENQFGNGIGFKITGQGFALHVDPKLTTAHNSNNKRYGQVVDEWSGNINLIAQANIYNYNVRVGYYQNFRAANSHFGTYGNPMGLDFWTAGVYDMGPSMNDIVGRHAVTGYFSGGGYHDFFGYGTFSWDVLARITRSPRSDEESIALTLNLDFNNGLFVGTKIEWLNDTTHKGYNLVGTPNGIGVANAKPLDASRTDDRSHAFFMLGYKF